MSKLPVEQDAVEMTFGGHLEELRARLIRSFIALFVVFVVAFIYNKYILDIIFAPMDPAFFTNAMLCRVGGILDIDVLCINQNFVDIINTKLAGQFNLHIKSSLLSAIVVTVPYIVLQLWLFIKPALDLEIQKQCKTFVLEVSLWFFIGLFFGYYIISPLAINFLTNYEVSGSISNMIDVQSYLSSVMGVSLAAALVFQLPVLVRLLAMMGVLHGDVMRRFRRFAFAGSVILSAVITPPDMFSQVLVALPLYCLYEYGIVITDRITKKREALEDKLQQE